MHPRPQQLLVPGGQSERLGGIVHLHIMQATVTYAGYSETLSFPVTVALQAQKSFKCKTGFRTNYHLK